MEPVPRRRRAPTKTDRAFTRFVNGNLYAIDEQSTPYELSPTTGERRDMPLPSAINTNEAAVMAGSSGTLVLLEIPISTWKARASRSICATPTLTSNGSRSRQAKANPFKRVCRATACTSVFASTGIPMLTT